MAFNTVTVKGDPIRKEVVASGTPLPGMLLERTNASTPTAKAHATAGGSANRHFALEDENQGGEITTAYTSGAQMLTAVFRPGDEVYALLADGESVAIADKVESNGDGYLRKVDADASAGDIGVQSIVGTCLEAADASTTTGDTPQRVLIEVW